MNRHIFALMLSALVLGGQAWAGTTGFSLTHEETNLTFPPLKSFTTGYKAEVGTLEVFSSDTAYLDNDPINGGSMACDPTSTKALIIDGTDFVSETHLTFPMIAQGNVTVSDRIQTGAERTDVDGLQFGVFSGVKHRPEVDFEFRADGYVYALGQKVDIGGGAFLRYDNVFKSDCGKGVDNHLTVDLFHNLVGGTVVVEITTHGTGGQKYRIGPQAMSADVKFEGIRGMYIFVPPGTGRYSVDGMVCTADAPIIIPAGGDQGGSGRTRY